ncbi:mediator complex subunit 13 C-terminal-domain-containing protein [Rhodocollybia butyracea]|uniref:Mediator of RNA polymerase II transcription subunit 13 n=1 Tax=Rhodocollybia butyracea TaxID=206335 RepID=A0A9P5UD13_9AGAR|nr:mediator complex subunit 13 C-terminal-domain-containing protein [Rhodocollybia butyracea]
MTFTAPSLDSQILASSIPLNADEISYLAYEGDHAAIWDLRSKFVQSEDSDGDILSTALWTVQVVSQSIHRLWLFTVGSRGGEFKPVIKDDRLIKVAEATITPRDLYPCSEECSHQTKPCSNCFVPSTNPTLTSAKHLPRRPWRRPWKAFLDAVRSSLVRQVNQSTRTTANSKRWACALKSGFTIGHLTLPSSSDEWVTSGWEQVRSHLYVHIQIQAALESSPRLIVHPTTTRTPYHALGSATIAGTALTMLPYGTPAYYVAPYSGPTSALTIQFRDALRGLGVDGWEGVGRPKKNGKGKEVSRSSEVHYAIVYILVHTPGNREKKGFTAIYPSRLLLALPADVRPPLNNSLLPTLPAPLQPSPQVPAAIVHSTASGPSNGTISSPINGPRSAYHLPTSATANAFPTLNSPLSLNFPYPPPQQQQLASSYAPSYPATSQAAFFGPSAGPPTPYAPAPSSTTSVNHPILTFDDSHSSFNPNSSNASLLRAHRIVSTASRLSSLAFPSPVTTPAAVPTPGAPTPGTVGALTPGGPSNSASTLTTPMRFLIPGSTTSGLHQTATEVSSYVDYVAKERDRERERLREAQVQKGRAGSASNIGASTSGTSNTSSSRSVPPISIPSTTTISPSSTATTTTTSNINMMGAGTDAQLFYPSPPTNPPSVSAAGAMSPAVMQGPALLPQIPQGLPSMHDTNKRVPVLEIHVDHRTELISKTNEIPGNNIMQSQIPSLKPSVISVAGDGLGENGISQSALPLPVGPSEHPSSTINSTPNGPAQPSPPTDPDLTSSWGYFGTDDMDLDGLGMLGMNGIGDMSGNRIGGDDIDALFGGNEANSFALDNLDNVGGVDWNMDSAFSFNSNAPPAASTTGVGVGATLYGATTNLSFSSFRSVNAPMDRTPTLRNASAHQSQPNAGSGLGIGMDFEADFTDDDFSFFDNKTSNLPKQTEPLTTLSNSSMVPPTASAPPALNAANVLASSSPDPLAFLNHEDASFFTSLGLVPSLHIGSAPTPGSYVYPSNSTPHSMSHPTPGGPTGSTPLTVDIEVEMDPGLPSPPEEPDRSSNLQTNDLSSPFPIRPTSHTKLTGTGSTSPLSPADKRFAPISFAKSHSVADGKYKVVGGKFAFLRSSSGWHKKSRPPYLRASEARRPVKGSGEAQTGETSVPKEAEDARKAKPELDRGRWTLPSPPVEGDTSGSDSEEDPLLNPSVGASTRSAPIDALSPSPTGSSVVPTFATSKSQLLRRGWRPRYDRATDPRIGVVRKLTEFKRKGDYTAVNSRAKRPKWIRDWEDETGRRIGDNKDIQNVDDSEAEDEEEGTGDEEDADTEAGDQQMDDSRESSSPHGAKFNKAGRRDRSRPATPLPVYIPPGPNLIATCFHWIHLAGMIGGGVAVSQNVDSEAMVQDSSNSQPSVYPGGLGTTHGAPTPVSPAAFVGTSASASPTFASTPGGSWDPTLTSSADTNPDKGGTNVRTLEATVNTIVQECVENNVWSDAWKTVEDLARVTEARFVGTHPPINKEGYDVRNVKWSVDRSMHGCVWSSDVFAVKQLLVQPKVLRNGLLTLGDLFGGWTPNSASVCTQKNQASSSSVSSSMSSTLSPLSPPLISVAKSKALVHVLPTALRFWNKLGLEPKGGKKNVTAFVLHEDGYSGNEIDQESGFAKAGSWRSEQIELWLKNMAELYKTKHFGEMIPGKSTVCHKDGLVALQFDSSFKESLASFVAGLSAPKDSFVFFVLTPLSLMTIASETLRLLFLAVKQTCAEAQVLFQFIPEPYVLNTAVHPSSPHDFRSESLLDSVYNRILMPVDRAMARKFSIPGKPVKNFFEFPAFTLARTLTENKVSYSCSLDASLDVLDRHTFLHVGYQLSSCGKWILAACIDQRGEAHDMAVWSTQPYLPVGKKGEVGLETGVISDEMYVVNKVWEFALQFAEKANVEWRIVFAKSGSMNSVELDAWMTHLCTALYSISKTQPPIHVSLLSTERTAPWIIPPLPLSSISQHSNSFKGSSSLSRSVSGSVKASSKSQFFVDTSTVAYSLLQHDSLPIAAPPTLNDIGLASDYIVNMPAYLESDDHARSDHFPLLPLSSSALIHAPYLTDSHTLPGMVCIHLLYTAKSEGCTYPAITSDLAESHRSLLCDITNSFHSLSILSSARWGMDGVNCLLPFHLSAVETMRDALTSC